jgi:hypothetical protein
MTRHTAPSHLADPERAMWAAICAEFDLDDAPGRAVLTQALEAHQLARECREAIERDGLMIDGRPHPLLVTLRDSRKAFGALMRQLDFVAGDIKRPVGRPPHPVGADLAILRGKP